MKAHFDFRKVSNPPQVSYAVEWSDSIAFIPRSSISKKVFFFKLIFILMYLSCKKQNKAIKKHMSLGLE